MKEKVGQHKFHMDASKLENVRRDILKSRQHQ